MTNAVEDKTVGTEDRKEDSDHEVQVSEEEIFGRKACLKGSTLDDGTILMRRQCKSGASCKVEGGLFVHGMSKVLV
ncbi:hypothetical protein RhiirA4_459888 [Rhizophagus irregularis]|uniref:Uncharacterized protein n=1 Tax=Rhizophagus irregularis TaxID=588596 RepID=A0A2I1GFD8_9GLOM|nr:hypothetical protein RhiirA4_459888 [Rhizophagus irregularis]